MATKRTSKKTFTNVTLEQAQEAAANFTKAKTELAKIEAKMNEEINKVKSKYADAIADQQNELEQPSDILEVYAKEQKSEWGKKKSLELLHATIGFRTSTPKVDKKKGFSWEAVLELIKKYPKFSHFVRTQEEVNKENILAEKDEKLLSELEDKAFVKIVQDEKFFIEPKVEEIAALV